MQFNGNLDEIRIVIITIIIITIIIFISLFIFHKVVKYW